MEEMHQRNPLNIYFRCSSYMEITFFQQKKVNLIHSIMDRQRESDKVS